MIIGRSIIKNKEETVIASSPTIIQKESTDSSSSLVGGSIGPQNSGPINVIQQSGGAPGGVNVTGSPGMTNRTTINNINNPNSPLIGSVISGIKTSNLPLNQMDALISSCLSAATTTTSSSSSITSPIFDLTQLDPFQLDSVRTASTQGPTALNAIQQLPTVSTQFNANDNFIIQQQPKQYRPLNSNTTIKAAASSNEISVANGPTTTTTNTNSGTNSTTSTNATSSTRQTNDSNPSSTTSKNFTPNNALLGKFIPPFTFSPKLRLIFSCYRLTKLICVCVCVCLCELELELYSRALSLSLRGH